MIALHGSLILRPHGARITRSVGAVVLRQPLERLEPTSALVVEFYEKSPVVHCSKSREFRLSVALSP